MKRLLPIFTLFLFLTIFLTIPILSHSAEPPKDPILRIETGMHTAMINRIAVDAENRFLVTGSDDKTVRVWELGTGRLIRTIRPPLGEGDEGKIYAVAISPDGRTIACGGWTGWDWDGSAYIYLFNRETGNLSKRITGLPGRILHLAYSKDGRYLAATLKHNNGFRIYGTRDYSLVAEDKDYGSDSYSADFDKEERLVTTSCDGYLRLYSPDFKLIRKKAAPGGNRPVSAVFSSDGKKIAVGFDDSTKVNVLSGADLSLLHSPDTLDVNNGNMGGVSWSLDGRYLYAGGRWLRNDIAPIRRWSDEGRGGFVDIEAATDTIQQILSLKNNGIAYAASDPAFGMTDQNGKKVIVKSPATPYYRDNQNGFLLSRNGDMVQFGYDAGGRSPASFSFLNRSLDIAATGNYDLKPPILSASGITITDWRNTTGPKLNNNPIPLDQNEISRSLAISPDGESFLLGTEWSIRLLDRSGSEKWNVPVPGVAWDVNISGNGRVAVAAFGDGTIRWYRMTDGKELMAFFPHKDKKRWVLWSPSGYYDASSGADELIGWHMNNGKDEAADFFPASKFRSTYYRPDVLAKVLSTLDESEAIRLANEEAGKKAQTAGIQQMLPPVVNIVSPTDGSAVTTSELVVKYNVRTPSGEPVTGIKALVDGRPVSTQRGVQVKVKTDGVQEVSITIPKRNCEVSIIAENRYAASEPVTVRISWRGKTKQDEFVIKPKLYVLAVGVSKYQDKALTLGLAAKDAKDFGAAAARLKGGLYRDVTVKVLADEQATKDNILDSLDWLQKETTSKDVAMVFFAGHGVNDQSGVYYYLPVNADTEKLKRTGVVFSDIKNTLDSLAGKTVLFIDTCHSGNVMGMRRGVADITAIVNELASAESGVVVFASSTGKQYSLEDPAWGNGAFTKALVEGLGGKADMTGSGRITINMLDLYLSERVKELTRGRQTPTTTKPQTVPDFPVAVKEEAAL